MTGAVALNHANFCVRNVGKLANLMVRHFSFTAEEQNDDYAILHGEKDFFVVVTRIKDDHPHDYPPDFHVGFRLAEHDAVRSKREALIADGYRPRDLQEFEALSARWTSFYLPVGDGMEFEVNARTPL